MNTGIELLQGLWKIKSLEIEGKTYPRLMFAHVRLEIRGDRFESRGMGAEYSGSIHLGPDAAPSPLDMQFDSGPEKGNTNLAIYQLSGDVLTLCIAMKGSVRPTAFATTPGSGIALEVLERIGPVQA